MSLQKTVTLTKEEFEHIPGRYVEKAPSHYRGKVIGLLEELGAEGYGIYKGDIVFNMKVDVADGSHREINFRIRPVLIQVRTKRSGGRYELVPKEATSWYLLWKHLEMKIAAIKVGFVEAISELMQYIALTDDKGNPVDFGEAVKWLIETDRLNQVMQLEYKRE
jgi:hypothetical protein